jgi:hypothetical protein
MALINSTATATVVTDPCGQAHRVLSTPSFYSHELYLNPRRTRDQARLLAWKVESKLTGTLALCELITGHAVRGVALYDRRVIAGMPDWREAPEWAADWRTGSGWGH